MEKDDKNREGVASCIRVKEEIWMAVEDASRALFWVSRIVFQGFRDQQGNEQRSLSI